MSDETLDLNEVESFSFLFKCLWSADSGKRSQMHIMDTILYRGGRPARWLFTNHEGIVMKRKDENINTQEIVRMFKAKSSSGVGVKDHRLKAKIATIWYVNQRNQIQGYLVDDLQLRGILDDTVLEILAVQLYIGGHQLKGSGVFEHRLYLRNNGSSQTNHKTHELVSVLGNDLSIYSPSVERLVVTETQHSALSKLAKSLAHCIQRVAKGEVANIVMQVSFTTAWVPILVAVRSVLLWHPDSNIVLYRSEALYATDPPLAPSRANPGSVLLPHDRSLSGLEDSPSPYGTFKGASNNASFRSVAPNQRTETGTGTGRGGEVAFQSVEAATPAAAAARGPSPSGHVHHGSGGGGGGAAGAHRHHHDITLDSEHELKSMLEVLTGSDIGESDGYNHKAITEQLRSAVAGAGPSAAAKVVPDPNRRAPAASDYDDANLSMRDTRVQNDRFRNGTGRRPLGASARGATFPAQALNGIAALTASATATAAPAHAMFAAAAPSPTAQFQKAALAMDREAGIQRRGSPLVLSVGALRPDLAATLALAREAPVLPDERHLRKNRGAIHKSSSYAQTAASRTRLEFYVNQLKEAEELPLDRMLRTRRPISAPHGVGGAGGGAGATSSQRGVGVMAGGHGVAVGGQRSSGFQKKAPLTSGTVCFGDYCFLAEFYDKSNKAAGTGKEAGVGVGQGEPSIDSWHIARHDRAASPSSVPNGEEAPDGDRDGDAGGGRAGSPSGGKRSSGDEGRAASPSSSPTATAAAAALTDRGMAASTQQQPSSIAAHIYGGVPEHRSDGGPPRGRQSDKLPIEYSAHGLSPFDLRQPLMKFQLPFRSIITLRSEEDFLRTRVYESWEGDEELDQQPRAAADTDKSAFAIPGHEQRLLDLAKRHLRRVAYCCLTSVRRTVVAMRAPHESGSGFNGQWQALSKSYRKQIYVDALAKTHPSRFYQTVPVCDTCQFIYSMADQHREEIVLGGAEPAAAAAAANSARPRSKSGRGRRSTTNGIAEARERGKQRREEAETGGQQRSSPDARRQYNNYADPKGPSGPNGSPVQRAKSAGATRPGAAGRVRSDSFNSDSNSNFDTKFDAMYFSDETGGGGEGLVVDVGLDGERGMYVHEVETDDAPVDWALVQAETEAGGGGCAEEGGDAGTESKLARRLKQETSSARDAGEGAAASIQIGFTAKDGKISSWVKKLTEPEPEPHTGALPAPRPTSSLGTSGKPNPMGPLAGQGIGSPKVQYRGFSAPVGFMLGQASAGQAGDVGSAFIDAKGNFVYPKRRSPAERGAPVPVPVSVSGTATATATAANASAQDLANNNNNTDVDSEPDDGYYISGEGIAYGSRKPPRSRSAAPKAAAEAEAEAGAAGGNTNTFGSGGYTVGHPNRSHSHSHRGDAQTQTRPRPRPKSAHAASSSHTHTKDKGKGKGRASGGSGGGGGGADHHSDHLQRQLQVMHGYGHGQGQGHGDHASSNHKLFSIEAYTFQSAHRGLVGAPVVSALSALSALSAMDAALGEHDSALGAAGGPLPSISHYRFDANTAPGQVAPHLPLTRASASANANASASADLQSSAAMALAYHSLPVYKSSGGTGHFENMLRSSAESLERNNGAAQIKRSDRATAAASGNGKSRPASAGARAGNSSKSQRTTRDRLQQSQELRRVREEEEDEYRRRVGYLGGLSIDNKVRDITDLYVQ